MPAIAGLALMAAVSAGCSNNVSDADIKYATLSEVRGITRSDKVTANRLLDPRSPGEFGTGHIPGAENLPLQSVPVTKDGPEPRLGRYKTLVVYGNDPGSAVARAMAKRLMGLGAGNVKLFQGGMVEWTKAGYPVERDAPQPSEPRP